MTTRMAEAVESKTDDIHQQHTPPMKERHISEASDISDVYMDNDLSEDAMAQKLSLFLSSSSDSGEEVESETVITSVYRDPLDKCMESIEDMAHGILRTGKLTITGDPGDMSKVQPSLFNLQASEKEMAQLMPQLMQTAFFYPKKRNSLSTLMPDIDDDEPSVTENSTDEALSSGFIRLALPVDKAIFSFLRSHSCKSARQAETLINTIIIGNYIPSHTLLSFPMMPPIIKFRPTTNHSLIQNGDYQKQQSLSVAWGSGSRANVRNSSSSLSAEDRSTTGSKLSTYSSVSTGTNGTSKSSLFESDGRKQSDDGSVHSLQSNSDKTLRHESITEIQEGAASISSISPPPKYFHKPVTISRSLSDRIASAERVRKSSIIELQPPMQQRGRGDSVGSDTSSILGDIYVPSNRWKTNVMDNNTIVAQYGIHPYPMVEWDSSFKIDFRMSSSVGLLSGLVTGIDPSMPQVTLRVFNNSPKQIGFSIRSYRQSTVFKSHVVYPPQGLEILGPYKNWEDNVEFYPNSPATTEMFVIDLFFCTMDTKAVWNINRKYVIMKSQKSQQERRLGRRKSQLHPPGSKELKEDNMKLVLSHGLQCVVKGILDKAEIIFSHALYLPDFQRVPLKAFVYICLAVVAKKRKDLGNSQTYTPMLVAGEASDKLVAICEQGPGSIKMPNTITLVKQLKKELNIQKITKEERKKIGIKRGSLKVEENLAGESEEISPAGGEVRFNGTKVVLPEGALTETTRISISPSDNKRLIPMLKSSGWEKIVQVVTALNIECSPPTDIFKKPVQITTALPEGTQIGGNSLVRLMHSRFLRHWKDITEDTFSKINLTDDKVYIETNLPGWVVVSVIQFNASMIAQMVLKSISIEPIMLRLSVYCKSFMDGDRNSIQVATFIVPCKTSEEPLYRELDKPDDFVAISFPHVVHAYPNETLSLEVKGCFEPDTDQGENDLVSMIYVHQRHNQVSTKWLRSTSSSHQPLCGTLKVSSCRNNTDNWESIASIGLAMRTGYVTPSTSSSSDH